MSVMSWVELGVIVAFVLKSIRDCIVGAPAFLAWSMFTQVKFCQLDAWVQQRGERVRLNQWDFIPNQEPLMGSYRLGQLLRYLHDVHGLDVNGDARYADGAAYRRLRIIDGRVFE